MKKLRESGIGDVMDWLLAVFSGIAILFFLLISVKRFVEKRMKIEICAICVAVSLTWISLLLLYYAGFFLDKTILAVLMGESVLGIFYTARQRFKEKLGMFQLPLLLTLTAIAYFLLSPQSNLVGVAELLALLWSLFSLLALFKAKRNLRKLAGEIMSCCRDA